MMKFRIGSRARRAIAGALLLSGLFLAVDTFAEEDAARAAATPGSLEFIGHNLFGDADGTFHAWRIVEKSVDPASLGDSYAVIEVDLSSVDTGIKRRDEHLRTADFFDVETYPVARVRVHSPFSSGQNEAGESRFTAQFDIDLHGVQKSVEGEITLVSEDPLTFEGSLVLDRMDFEIGAPPSRWNPMSVRKEVPVSFRIAL